MKAKHITFLAVLAMAIIMAGMSCKRTVSNSSDREALDLLLKDDDIIGLKKSGDYRLANDFNSLYDVINGGAQLYIDNGFEEGVFQPYTLGSSSYNIEVYDQGSGKNARMVYDEVYPPSVELFFSSDTKEAVVDQSQMNSYTINYYQNNFFVRINATEKSDAALNMAKLICSSIVGKLE